MARNKNTAPSTAVSEAPAVRNWNDPEVTVESVKVGDEILIEGITGFVQHRGAAFALVTTAVDPATGRVSGMYGNLGARALKPEHKPAFGGQYAFIGSVPEAYAGVPQSGIIDASTNRAIPADRLDAARELFASAPAVETPSED